MGQALRLSRHFDLVVGEHEAKVLQMRIQTTVKPKGYHQRDFNEWQKQLQKEMDKMFNTNVAVNL